MRAATFCSPAVRPRIGRRSGHPMIVSEIEGGKIRRKRRLVLETAQIQDLRAILDTSDDRNGEAAKRSSKSSERATCATLGTRADRQAGAWHGLQRQCAGAYLARAGNDLDLKSILELCRDDRQQPLRHGFDRWLRTCQEPDRRQL